MSYVVFQNEGVTSEQAEDLRLARSYAQLESSDAWRDLSALIEEAAEAAQSTLYQYAGQDSQVIFGLTKRWQERGAMRDIIMNRIKKFKEIAESIKEEINEHSGDDAGNHDQ